jgi:transcriptional regulator
MCYREEADNRRKLTDDDVRELRQLRQQGTSQKELAERFSCTQQNVCAILKGRSRADVSDVQGEVL